MKGTGYPYFLSKTELPGLPKLSWPRDWASCGPTHTNTHRSVGDSRRKGQAETFCRFFGIETTWFRRRNCLSPGRVISLKSAFVCSLVPQRGVKDASDRSI